MYLVMNVQVDWDVERESRRVVFARLRKVFADFKSAFPQSRKPKDGVGWVDIRGEDKALVSKVMAWMDRTGEDYQIVLNDYWSTEELVRARWLVPRIAGPGIEYDERWLPLNTFPRKLCKVCGLYDDRIVDEPYKVNKKRVTGNQEIFEAGSRLIVKDRVGALLKELLGNEVDWGEVAVRNRAGKVEKNSDHLSWVRPKHSMGRNTDEVLGPPCPKCKVRLADPHGMEGGFPCNKEVRLLANRATVDHYGQRAWNIAWVGTLYGGRGGGRLDLQRKIVLSGGLWAHLYNCGVKGLMLPDPPSGIYSAKGENPIEAERRFAGPKLAKDDKILRLKMSWEKRK